MGVPGGNMQSFGSLDY